MQVFLQTFINSLQNIALYSMATIGIVLIFRTSITTNFAQGMMGTFSAFFTANFVLYHGMPFWAGITIGALIAFCFGYLIDAGIIRHGREVNASGRQMITMGLMMIFYAIMPAMFVSITTRTPNLPKFSYTNLEFSFLGQELYITEHALICLVIAVIGLSILFFLLKWTKWGMGLRATASNEVVAQMMGINTKFITGVTWGIAGLFVAVAASSTAMSLNAGMMGTVQIYGFLACVLGGLSSFGAPIAGCVLIPLFLNYSAVFSPKWAGLISFILIMLIILVRPNGLFGKKLVKKV
ncbi:MAG: branched-chain amino acid ABC transporter permease [Spirochaetales bacterium]|jgi:branched-chain amino acid transport system permease protein|nr:branched-chain amino acid ABC transporter permease [Spirochaetales bacterium]